MVSFVLHPVLALATRGKSFEAPDMADCTFHETDIRSLCCTLKRDCQDSRKKPMELGGKPGAEPA